MLETKESGGVGDTVRSAAWNAGEQNLHIAGFSQFL